MIRSSGFYKRERNQFHDAFLKVETILSFEEKWKKKRGIPIDQKLLPKSKCVPQLENPAKSTNNSLPDKQEEYVLIEDKIR